MIEQEKRSGDIPIGDTARILAILYTLGFFAMVMSVMWVKLPPENDTLISQLVAILSIIQTGIVAFYFGGSKSAENAQIAGLAGRAKADEALQSIAKAVPDVAAAIAPLAVTTPTVTVQADNATISENNDKAKSDVPTELGGR